MASLNLDGDNPAALQRARLCALIFSEWRDDVVHRCLRENHYADPPRDGCRLPHIRAALASLIAGLGPEMERPTPAPDRLVCYAEAALPAGGLAGGFVPTPQGLGVPALPFHPALLAVGDPPAGAAAAGPPPPPGRPPAAGSGTGALRP